MMNSSSTKSLLLIGLIGTLILESSIHNAAAFVQPTTRPSATGFGQTFCARQSLACQTFLGESKSVLRMSETTEDAPVTEEVAGGEDDLEKAEKLGRGSAKAKRGKRKGGAVGPDTSFKASVTLAPEEVFYEGAPAITETIIPTISILTVVGIIPAAAAWARQAWVRYKITSRRVRVTSGIGGNDMAEIVYPDIVELRTVKRLFGDVDMVFFLRDGAKFEMRNVPNFEETVEFILGNLDKDVAATYRAKGDVTNPPQ